MCHWRDYVISWLERKNEPGSAQTLLAAFDNMKQADIDEDLLMDLNDSGYRFDEIADYLDRVE